MSRFKKANSTLEKKKRANDLWKTVNNDQSLYEKKNVEKNRKLITKDIERLVEFNYQQYRIVVSTRLLRPSKSPYINTSKSKLVSKKIIKTNHKDKS